jgi:hypothetical protein
MASAHHLTLLRDSPGAKRRTVTRLQLGVPGRIDASIDYDRIHSSVSSNDRTPSTAPNSWIVSAPTAFANLAASA